MMKGLNKVVLACSLGLVVSTYPALSKNADAQANTLHWVKNVPREPTGSLTPFLIGPPQPATETANAITTSSTASASPSNEETFTAFITSTVLGQGPTSTVTITANPSLATATVTATVIVSSTVQAIPGKYWSSPPDYTDYESFKITHFVDGQPNMKIVDGEPPNVTLSSPLGIELPEAVDDLTASLDFVDNPVPALSSIQVRYPANSLNPTANTSVRPIGGGQFYATPIPLDNANNLTFEYSVFFPKNFSFVEGGKLPGLYGGREGCSGGYSGTDCFSTRLMWRSGGRGELYLYAPKDEQTDALCNTPPESICDEEYGLSIGRGSFHFGKGNWTTVRQTVVLNTPGQQDGGFTLEVNGRVVIDRSDIYYRGMPPVSTTTMSATTTKVTSTDDTAPTSSEGLLSPLLGSGAPLLGDALDAFGSNAESLVGDNDDGDDAEDTDATSPQTTAPPEYAAQAAQPETSIHVTSYIWPSVYSGGGKEVDGSSGKKSAPVTFAGIFFSTFFGGNTEDFATPIDQYTWFKDFSLTINS